MYSDTHFHFRMITEERGGHGTQILSDMARRNCYFGLDIGTSSDDLQVRVAAVEKAISKMDASLSATAKKFMYYSAGIWPDVNSIHNRQQEMEKLEKCIIAFNENTKNKLVAIGEGGLDHHWNPSGNDGRSEADFDEKTYRGERELFQMQLELAKKLNLPMIVHSRDAFEDSLDCIKNVGYHNGIIHCYSYGIEQARKFLDLGWYIAFGGSTTYTKKSKMEEMKTLLQYIPADRFLCETDAPYLAPVPFRGQTNTPVLVEEVYKFIAEIRKTSPQTLSDLVDFNIKTLFKLKD